MPRLANPPSPLVEKLQGVHLFHFDGAPCAQRVRFALGEKGLVRGVESAWNSTAPETLLAAPGTWISRQVSLLKKRHLSDEYAAIQPNMVVPALLHDGVLYVESMDIIRYVDEQWSRPRLFPTEPNAAQLNEQLIKQGVELHVSVRYVSFRWGLGRLGKLNAKHEQTLKRLERADSPEHMASFYGRFDRDEIDEQIYCQHLMALNGGYSGIDQLLAEDGRPFLCGDALSASDILWALKVLRIHECGYPFRQRHPALHAWFERIRARPAFQQSVMGHHRFMSGAFRAKAAIEHMLGIGIRHADCWKTSVASSASRL